MSSWVLAAQKDFFNQGEKARIYREAYADLHWAVIHYRSPIPKEYSVW
jgi:hypothetical protein